MSETRHRTSRSTGRTSGAGLAPSRAEEEDGARFSRAGPLLVARRGGASSASGGGKGRKWRVKAVLQPGRII